MSAVELSDFFSDEILTDLPLAQTNVKTDIQKHIGDSLEDKLAGLKIITNEIISLDEDNFASLCEHSLPCSNSVIDLILENIQRTIQSQNLNDGPGTIITIQKYIKMTIEVMSCVQAVLEYIHQNSINLDSLISCVPGYVLEILFKLFNHCKNSKVIYGDYFDSLNDVIILFKKAQEINSQFVTVCESQLNFSNCKIEDRIYVKNVFEILGQIGEILSGLNAKSMIETWKMYINLLQKYLDNVEDSQVSFSQPLKFFSSEIQNNIKAALNSEPSETKTLQQIFKITLFLTKIACRIISMQKGGPNEEIISFFIEINNFNPEYVELKSCSEYVKNSIKTSVFEPSDTLLQYLVKDIEFHKALQNIPAYSEPTVNENIKGYTVLLFFVFDLLVQNCSDIGKDVPKNILLDYLDLAFYLVEKANADFFKASLVSHKYSTSNNLYDALIIHLTRLFDVFPNNYLEKKLLTHILSENIENAFLATDIWICFIGSQPPEYGWYILNILIESSKELLDPTFCERQEAAVFGNLFLNIYNKLPNEYKLKFIDKYPPCNFLYLWKYLKLSIVPNSYNLIEPLLEKFTTFSKLLYTLKISNYEFISLCNVCDVLSTADFQRTSIDLNSISNAVKNLWVFNTDDKEVINLPGFNIFFEKLCKITQNIHDTLNCDDLIKVFNKMDNVLNFEPNNLLFILDFIVYISAKNFEGNKTSKIISIIINFFVKGLTSSNVSLIQYSLESFEHFFKNTPYKKIAYDFLSNSKEAFLLVKNYLQRKIEIDDAQLKNCYDYIRTINFEHVCKPWPEIVFQSNKRFKADAAFEIVEKIKEQVQNLQELKHTTTFSDEVFANIVHVSEQLQQLIKS